MSSCAVSTPRLKPRRPCTTASPSSVGIRAAAAKPSPCRRPKVRAMPSEGRSGVRAGFQAMTAARAMDAAMATSIQGPGEARRPVQTRASVALWPRVKASDLPRAARTVPAPSRRVSMKRAWSQPSGMTWPKPRRPKSIAVARPERGGPTKGTSSDQSPGPVETNSRRSGASRSRATAGPSRASRRTRQALAPAGALVSKRTSASIGWASWPSSSRGSGRKSARTGRSTSRSGRRRPSTSTVTRRGRVAARFARTRLRRASSLMAFSISASLASSGGRPSA